jgi:hypothetical protein
MILLGLVMSLGMLTTACSKARKVETDLLSQSFVSAPAEVRAEVQKAVAGIKAKDYTVALTALKTVTESVELTDDQKRAVSDSVTDITVILTENPPENADALYDMIEEITDAVS